MVTPPTQPGIKITFQSPYKGGTKQWSNTWHLTGGDWANQSQFNTLADDYVNEARTWIPSNSSVILATGYNGGSFLPVFSKSYSTAGTATDAGHGRFPLEACMLVKGTTTQRSKRNHPIYIFKYVHAVMANSNTDGETPQAGAKGALTASLASFVTGVSDGSNTRKWAGPRGAVVQAGSVETYCTHRDFPR